MSDSYMIMGKLMMEQYCTDRLLNLKVLHVTGMLLMLVAVAISGCASAPGRPVETAVTKPVTAEVVVTDEMRAEFDAAMTHIKAEEYDAAIELLAKVLKTAPNLAVPNINLALAYKKTGKIKQAEESLKLALNAEADNPVANNELALLYRKTGRFAEARQVYEKILEKYPNFRMVHKNLGILCDLYMKDYECALKHYVFYSDVVQDDKTVKIWIADLQKRTGK
jgi:tetratricopeptide (TPR) repeat protein